MQRIINLINKDKLRLKALDCVCQLGLPQCYIAAGFVRNLVWDHLHQFEKPTSLNDIDVIYFAQDEREIDSYKRYELHLKNHIPELNWQVRNQAFMHTRNFDKPYISTLDAMSHWPEKETAIAIRKIESGVFECISAFGYESLFNLEITHNSKRSKSMFNKRINEKKWLEKWSNLTIVCK